MHIKAPINVTGDGTRWSQCAKCRKVFGLSEGFDEGSHLCCGDCGQNLLLKKMTMVEWEALTEQYPQPSSPVMTTIKPPIVAQWECTAVKFEDFTNGAESLSLHHQFVGRIKRRDSSEADAAQDLIMTHGANPSVIMRAASNNCVFALAKVQDGRLYIPVDKPVSLTSPLAIQMLMHFYAMRERFIPAPVSAWPPAQRGIIEGFKAAGLIFERAHEDFGTTDKGSLIVETLESTFKEALRNV